MVSNVWLVLLFPIIGFFWCVIFGRLWPRFSGWVASIMIGLAFAASVSVLVGLLGLAPDDRVRIGTLYTWIGSGVVSIPLGILVDPLSTVMILIVSGVSFLIHIYALGYMRDDPGFGRFFSYMNLFVLSMLLLVLSDNFLLLLVGWAGVGLCSYLLISFWFEKPEAAAAGVEAFVVNAVGDAGLILAAALILITFKSLNYVTVFADAKTTLHVGGGTVTAITLLLLVAAVAKSAQLPLYFWLPDAMAGPTPVSALIHAATMVTAGVYLIARASPLFTMAPFTMEVIAWIGAITALFAATIGLVKPNLKRVLAYSTVSQLGYMFLAVGVGGFAAGIFHLMSHAFFKAMLFLAAGAVIHALAGEEDMRKMGGLRKKLPFAYFTFLAATLAISGTPGFSGFFSKDEIISLAFTSPQGNAVLGIIGVVTAGLTAVYMFRAFFMTFHGESRVDEHVAGHMHKPGAVMLVPMVILGVLSVIGGYIQFPTGTFDSFLLPAFTYFGVTPVTENGINPVFSGISVLAGLIGFVIAYGLWYRNPKAAVGLGKTLAPIRVALLNDYGVYALVEFAVIGSVRWLGRACSSVVDSLVIEGIVNGIAVSVRGISVGVARLESGYVRTYAVAILAGTIVIIAFMARGGL